MSQVETHPSAGSNVDLSIVIVNWNTRDLLVQCLHSIQHDRLAQQRLTLEVIVVDNGSGDGSVQVVRRQFPEVRVMENLKNAGFARANNQAIAASRGRYILLLNSDTRVIRGALSSLLEFMEDHPDAGGAGARVLNPDGTLQVSCFPFPTLSREFWYLLHLDLVWPYAEYRMARWEQDTARFVDVLLGACLMLRRESLGQVGSLDEDFFMYSEEVDLCYRLHKAGWRLYWVPEAEVVHYGGQSTKQAAEEMFLQLYRSKVMFFRKHYGNRWANLYKAILFISSLPRVALALPGRLAPHDYRARFRKTAANYRQLLQTLPHF